MAEKILRTEYSEEMQKSYLDYSMSVITARAIPDARDGLKPVQRRVLYDMSELHLSHDKPHRKSARIVGDTMGKYHPHGDSSIYETLVVMSQPFKRGMPLVDGHGNFGSIEGDGAAAMRYTEAKLQKFAEEVYLRDLDKTVRFVSNYDETEKEPEVLPVRIPNLLVNGAEGIAVGMSTSIPPHNLGEVCDACIAYIKNPEIKYEKLLGLLKGPDFPTGGIVANQSELPLIYRTGVGKIKLRGRIEVELGQKRSDRDKLVITEIPYTMVGAGIDKFLMDVAALVESKKLPEVVDISNQSSKEGVRIVLELRRDADLDRVKNMLYKKTKLEDSFGVNMLAIADGRPETLDLKGILKHYLAFQYANAEKKYETLLEKERLKQEVQEGLIAACDCIDLIIAILRGAKKLEDAKACLTTGDASRIYFKDPSYLRDAMQLHFTERQAQAILEMRLYKLIGLEILALEKEHAETLKKIETYEGYLSSREKLDKLLIKDLEAIKKEYAHERRTRLEDSKEAVVEEKAPEDEPVIFLLDRFGYAKLLDVASYEKNREQIESEYRAVVPIMTSGRIQLYTSAGVLHQVKVRDIPAGKLKDKGVPIDNLSRFDGRKEEIYLVAAAGSLSKEQLLFVSREGYVKLVDGAEFETANKTVVATKLGDEDAVTAVLVLGKGKQEVLLLSGENYALRFYAEETPQMKKNARGVRGMRLGSGDYVQKALLLPPMEEFVFNGKKVNPEKIRRGHRDTKGEKLK
ncbi:DNA topoisomerase (ATP-hydrolyzing) [Stomatobaculum sp. F0698]|uniref:DNA gyrase/topoisomerase IV subunit A n=1 Tax=Stomatobaculum sp. F0698 TaxID=3059030 RepID=UPI0027296806|nr:DNA topoisomerase (ATP-hydrolyzing) [Stomatobaculum sp. F0698]WLD87210.1 DNA topoisomerase (ATP-hydrolyzing) [Stomatobaculum sp. F0698]